MLYCASPGSMEICLAVATAAAQLPASSSSLLPRQRQELTNHLVVERREALLRLFS